MAIMDRNIGGEEVQKHLEERLGFSFEENDRRITIWPHKRRVVVNDADLFDKIATAYDIDKTDFGIRLDNYYINTAREGETTSGSNMWLIALDADQLIKFITTYGEKYKLG